MTFLPLSSALVNEGTVDPLLRVPHSILIYSFSLHVPALYVCCTLFSTIGAIVIDCCDFIRIHVQELKIGALFFTDQESTNHGPRDRVRFELGVTLHDSSNAHALGLIIGCGRRYLSVHCSGYWIDVSLAIHV